MTDTSPDRAITGERVSAQPKTDRIALILAAWTATLLLSKLPLIVAREFLGTDIPWITPAWIIIAILLFALTFVWHALKPLRNYFAILGAIILAGFVLPPLVTGTSIWQNGMTGLPSMWSLFASRVLVAVEALIVLAVLFSMGVNRRDAFLTAGNLSAPVGGRAEPGKRKPLSWAVMGVVAAVGLSVLFFTFLASQNPGILSGFDGILPWLPLVLVCAMLNAFGEEAMFRAAPLATLNSPVGPTQALWMTSIYFGLGHFYGGIPSGFSGFVMTGALALLLGKAMLDTRGFGWPWIIHVAMDTAIYLSLALVAITAS